MIVDEENRHYTTIKNWSKEFNSLNSIHKEAYHFCMNCVNGLCLASARDKHSEHSSSNGHVKLKTSSQKLKRLKFHDD